jgi:hypothetical protein
MRFKRLLYYLTINVLVSACTIFAVIRVLDRYESSLFPARAPQGLAFMTPPRRPST